MYLVLLTAAIAPNGVPSAVKATGSLATVTAANIVDGENFALNDGMGGCCVFVFDKDGVYADAAFLGAPRHKVNLVGAVSADDVRDRIITAINECPFVRITASSGGAAAVTLTNDVPGPLGNTAIAEQVANAGFVPTNFTGGVLSGVESNFGGSANAPENEDASILVSATADAAVTLTATVAIWGYVPDALKWYRHKALNGAAAIAETGTDTINYAETVYGLRQYSRLYAELQAVAGANASVNVSFQSRL